MPDIRCPHCGNAVASDPNLAGQVVACPACRNTFRTRLGKTIMPDVRDAGNGHCCPHCGNAVASDPNLAGQVVACPACRNTFAMPEMGIPVAAPSPPPLDPFPVIDTSPMVEPRQAATVAATPAERRRPQVFLPKLLMIVATVAAPIMLLATTVVFYGITMSNVERQLGGGNVQLRDLRVVNESSYKATSWVASFFFAFWTTLIVWVFVMVLLFLWWFLIRG